MPRNESTVDMLKRELSTTNIALENARKLLEVEQEASRRLLERYKTAHEEGNNLRMRLVEANRDLTARNNVLRRKLSRMKTIIGKLAAESITEE